MRNNQKPEISFMKQKAKEMRKDILKMLAAAGSGHPGGSLSAVELIAGLYFYKLKHRPEEPEWEERDIFILSKGHACPALYAVLAETGYFPKEELLTLRKLGSRLQGHPEKGLPGVEISSGSLGQGLSIANGFAISAKMDNRNRRVYCLMGDGELNEGQVWEAAMTGWHFKLDNVCAVIDHNGQQIDGWLRDTKNTEPIRVKWESFGWKVIEVDGHNIQEVMRAYDEAEEVKGAPCVILGHTIKGKGVSFMEHVFKWHGVAPKEEELEKALKELE